MQDSKDKNWAGDYERNADVATDQSSDDQASASNSPTEVDGWQQYRRWISKAPVTRSRRTGVDPSLYTWKGYRNWTEQVKRNWSDS